MSLLPGVRWGTVLWAVLPGGVILLFHLSTRHQHVAAPSLKTRILLSSTEDSCLLVPRFCWRRRGKETANQEKKPTLSKRETFPCSQTLVGGGQPSSGPCSRLTPAVPGAIQPPEVFPETNNWTRRYVGRCRPPRSQTLRTRL